MQTSPHKIEQSTVTADDIGSAVTYVPRHAKGNANHEHAERGHITSWNDTYIFVQYSSNTKATKPEDLVWG